MKLWNLIKTRMMENPTKQICENDAKLSFEEIVIWSESFAQRLQGIHCCAILCSSEMASAMSLLACFAAGVTAVPLSMRYGQAHYNKILNTISPDAIIMDSNGELSVYKIKDYQYVDSETHPAIIMCTSGTTGKPKGVMLTEKNIITNVTDISEYFAIDTKDSILIARPIYHCAVLTGEFLTALMKGANIRFYSDHFNPTKILELIKKHNISAFCGTPTFLSIMARFNQNTHKQTLRHICISGECMSKEISKKISEAFPLCNIYHVYGLTEACPRVSFLPPHHFKNHAECVGIPLKSVSIKIVDEMGDECKENKEGILWVKGDNIMLGYYNDPDQTRKVIKDGWLCTGDVAVIDNSGFLKIKGRRDELIIKSGMNIYPSEIEFTMKQDDRVKDAFAYGFQTQFGMQIGLKISGDFNDTNEIKKLCIELLPSFQVPSVIDLLDELPKTCSGKVMRR